MYISAVPHGISVPRNMNPCASVTANLRMNSLHWDISIPLSGHRKINKAAGRDPVDRQLGIERRSFDAAVQGHNPCSGIRNHVVRMTASIPSSDAVITHRQSARLCIKKVQYACLHACHRGIQPLCRDNIMLLRAEALSTHDCTHACTQHGM